MYTNIHKYVHTYTNNVDTSRDVVTQRYQAVDGQEDVFPQGQDARRHVPLSSFLDDTKFKAGGEKLQK
jgi:hypothetical protein